MANFARIVGIIVFPGCDLNGMTEVAVGPGTRLYLEEESAPNDQKQHCPFRKWNKLREKVIDLFHGWPW
jgi:hypothetical protein